jgi:2-dehydropantoate 2-reductase
MWLDLKAGRRTELAQLGGYVVRRAEEQGIDVPVTRRCVERIHQRIDEATKRE